LGFHFGTYAMCFHATARIAKAWQESDWIIVGKYLVEQGITPVFPWGNQQEKIISERLVKAIPGSVLLEAFTIAQAAILVAQARLTIGVDTGLTHLSAILNFPTIELYIDSPKWKTEGYWSDQVINLGDIGAAPSISRSRECYRSIIKEMNKSLAE
jgi:heptosyltransferase-1